jgi:hypothetical protein
VAITYGAGPGTVITSFAMNETLGDQSQQSGDNTVVVSDDISTIGNGQIGTGFPTYVGRLILIELGATEQYRMVVSQAAGTGNTIILTVGEDWDSNPAQNDTIHVSYNLDDIETGGAGGGIGLNSKSGLYELTNDLTIGNATDPAGLTMTGLSSGVEHDDTGSTLQNFVKNNGYMFAGFTQGGVSANGAIMTWVNNSAGEPSWRIESGGKVLLYGSLIWGQLVAVYWECANGSDAQFIDTRILSASYASEFFDATLLSVEIDGRGATTELIRFDAGTTVLGLILMATAGLTTASGDTTTESITARDVVFIDNIDNLVINSNKTWYLINPVWTVTTYNDALLNWLTTTANYVYDQRSIDVLAQEADGTVIPNAVVVVHENTTLDDLVLETFTDSNGIAAGVFTLYLHSTGSSTTTYGGHSLRVDAWSYFPFIATQVSTEAFDSVVVLNPDSNIQAASQAAALTAGSGITWNEDTNPSSIISYTAGTGTLSVGNTVTGGTSGADGIVTKIVSGDSSAGTVHLKTRDAVDFSGTETLSNGAGWSATLTNGSQQDFSIWIDGDAKSLQTIHDYLAALTSETTLSATGELIHEWGRDSQARALYIGVDGFTTERSYGLGVFITDYGAGTIDYFTDDAGGTWTPPATTTVTLTGMQDNTEVRVMATGTQTELAGIENATDGSPGNRSFAFSLTASTVVDIWLINLIYENEDIVGYTVPAVNTSLPQSQRFDRNYANP